MKFLFPNFEGPRVTTPQVELIECCSMGMRDAMSLDTPPTTAKCVRPSAPLSTDYFDGDSIRSTSVDACQLMWRYCCLTTLSWSECKQGKQFALNSYQAKQPVSCRRPSTRLASSLIAVNNEPSQAFQCCLGCQLGIGFGKFLGEKRMPDQYCRMSDLVPANMTANKVDVVMRTPFIECCRRAYEDRPWRNKKQAPTAAEGLAGLGLSSTASEKEIHATIEAKVLHLIENTSLKRRLCNSGYEYNITAGQCLDIDECISLAKPCRNQNEHCINTIGGFYCAPCPKGFRHRSHMTPAQLDSITVKSTTDCYDIDECKESSSICRLEQVCVNKPGGHECTCKVSAMVTNSWMLITL